MSQQKIIYTLVEYHTASNSRLSEHLMSSLTDGQFTQPIDYSHGSIRSQVVHMAATDRYWLHDIQSKPVTGLEPEDYPTLKSFIPTWEGIEAELGEYVNSLSDVDLESVPDGLMESRWEALAHIVNHGTDHRAQILSMLHSLGVPTFEQDLPGFLRSQRWVSKAAVLKLIQYWRANWEQAFGSIPQESRTKASVGGLPVKDILAQIIWYEQQMVSTLKSRQLSGSALWEMPQDKRNQQIYEQSSSQPLEEVLKEYEQSFPALIQEIERLDDDDLNDPSRIQNMPLGKKLWEILERDIWTHYMRHTEALWSWLENK
jgi:uncharacterized damage-inducible protein DinB